MVRSYKKKTERANIDEAKLAYFESFTGKNISSAFAKPGIVPFNKLALSDEDFAPCEIYSNQNIQDSNEDSLSLSEETVRTATSDLAHKTPPRTDPMEAMDILETEHVSSAAFESIPSTSNSLEAIPLTSKTYITPEAVKPYPKINKTSISKKRKGKGKSRKYTDTPEKQRLQELQNSKEQKKLIQEQRKCAGDLKTALSLREIAKKPMRNKTSKTTVQESDTSNSFTEIVFNDSSSNLGSDFLQSNDDLTDETIEAAPPKLEDFKEGDFFIVKLKNKNIVEHFVGKILFTYDGGDLEVSCMRRKPSGTFVYPDIKDEASVHISDIVLQLPTPVINKTTGRTASLFNFRYNLSPFNL